MLSKISIFTSYSSHLYAAILSIVVIPVYAKHLGIEAYGLIGFSLTLQGIALVFDLGLAQTFMRENARSRADSTLNKSALYILHSGEWLFFLFSVFIISLFYIFSEWLSNNWLQATEIANPVVSQCIIFIATAACLRWFTNFYRCGLFGHGDHIWVHLTSILVATIRYLGVIPLIINTNYGLVEFFLYQAIVGALESLLYRLRLYKHSNMNFSPAPPSISLLWNYKNILAPIFFATCIWVAMTQLDKLLLSHLLDLKNYGYFSLALAMAGVVLLLSIPLNQLLQPQLTTLAEAGKRKEMITLYRLSTQILTAGFISIASLVAFFAEPILLFWTGDMVIAREAKLILPWYVMGNAVAALLTLPYMLQFAVGNLRLHTIGNFIFAICWLPSIIWATQNYGGIGAGIVWLSGNILFLLVWTSIVYNRMFRELFFTWIIKDVLAIAIPIILSAYLLSLISQKYNSLALLITLASAALAFGITGLFLGQHSREYFVRLIRS